nr:hypothetical protein [uncultured Halomonas sp.]
MFPRASPYPVVGLLNLLVIPDSQPIGSQGYVCQDDCCQDYSGDQTPPCHGVIVPVLQHNGIYSIIVVYHKLSELLSWCPLCMPRHKGDTIFNQADKYKKQKE